MELVLGAVIAVLSFFLGAIFRPYLTGYATKKGRTLPPTKTSTSLWTR